MADKKMKMRLRLGMVFTKEQMERLSVSSTNDGVVTVRANVHNMTCQEAKTFLKNVIALFRGAFRLIVVHGFHHGTCIRDMISRELLSDKVVRVNRCQWNEGITEIDIRALCA